MATKRLLTPRSSLAATSIRRTSAAVLPDPPFGQRAAEEQPGGAARPRFGDPLSAAGSGRAITGQAMINFNVYRTTDSPCVSIGDAAHPLRRQIFLSMQYDSDTPDRPRQH